MGQGVGDCGTTQFDLLAESLSALMRDVEAMQRLHRLAERRGRLQRNSLVARELVTDAIEDALMGEVTCDPSRELAPQIERLVLLRANALRRADRPGRERRGASRPEFVPLDKAPTSALVIEPPQQALEDDDSSAPDAGELASRIRELAREDEAAKQLLAYYDRDVVLRRDVLAAGMTAWVYRSARDRLANYAALAISGVATAAQMPAETASMDAGLPTTLAIEPTGRTARARRAAARTFDRSGKLRSA